MRTGHRKMKMLKGVLTVVLAIIIICVVYNALSPGTSTGTDGSRLSTSTQPASQSEDIPSLAAATQQTANSNVLTGYR